MASTPAQTAAKFTRLAATMQNFEKETLNEGAFAMKKAIQAQYRRAVPGGRLTNVGKRGARVGVRYNLYPHSAKVFAYGPAHLVENDVRPHRIPRQTIGRGRRKRANTKPIFIPGVGVRAYAMHPGTRGKHPWATGVRIGVPKAQRAAGTLFKKTIGSVFP